MKRPRKYSENSFFQRTNATLLSVFTVLFLALIIPLTVPVVMHIQQDARMRRYQENTSSHSIISCYPGGNANISPILCPTGYWCKVPAPDASGVCIPCDSMTCPRNPRSSPIPSSLTVTPRPTRIPNFPVGSSCGEVDVFGTVVANPPQAETCFLNAFQQCQPRTLTFTSGVGLESINTHVFTLVKNGGACTITDRFTNTTQNVPPPLGGTHTATYTCSSLTQQNGGLLFSNCGAEGNVSVPPPH